MNQTNLSQTNLKATIEIPTSKLLSKGNFISPKPSQCCCQFKIEKNCCQFVPMEQKKPTEYLQMIEEIQEAYRSDMKAKNQQIKLSQIENIKLREKIGQLNNRIIGKEKDEEKNKNYYENQIKNFNQEIFALKNQLAEQKNRNQSVLKNRIMEFKSSLTLQLRQKQCKIIQLHEEIDQIIYSCKQKQIYYEKQIQTLKNILLEKEDQNRKSLQTMQNKLSQITIKNSQLFEINRVLKEQNAGLDQLLQKQKKDKEQLLRRNLELQHGVNSEKNNVCSQKQINTNLSLLKCQLQAQIDNLKIKQNNLQQKLGSVVQQKQNALCNVEKQKIIISGLENELKEKQRLVKNVETLQAQIQLLRKCYTENGVVQNKINDIIQKLSQQHSLFKNKKQLQCQNLSEQISNLKNTNNQQNEILLKQAEQLQQLKQLLSSNQTKLSELEKQLCCWKCKYYSCEQNLKKIRFELEKIEAFRIQSEEKNKDLRQENARINDCNLILKGKLAESQRDCCILREEMLKLRKQVKNLHLLVAEKQQTINQKQTHSHFIKVPCNRNNQCLASNAQVGEQIGKMMQKEFEENQNPFGNIIPPQ